MMIKQHRKFDIEKFTCTFSNYLEIIVIKVNESEACFCFGLIIAKNTLNSTLVLILIEIKKCLTIVDNPVRTWYSKKIRVPYESDASNDTNWEIITSCRVLSKLHIYVPVSIIRKNIFCYVCNLIET